MKRNKKTALYIGRFQPFHLGHKFCLEYINNVIYVDKIIIAIGSSDSSHTQNNPFTADERKMMIELSGKVAKLTQIFKVNDDPSNKIWTAKLIKTLPKFEIVFTNNPLVARLLKEQGKQIQRIPFALDISGTKLRLLIKLGKQWENFVPEQTAEIINRIGGTKRIQQLSEQTG